MKKISLLLLFLSLIMLPAFSQKAKNISIPDIPGYKTLKGDFHMHTVFSDGLVWPTVRIDEAVNEGLDVIAITDHIEYRPHLSDVPSDHNRSYDIEKPYADKKNIILVKGTEITRAMPPGHFNALFINDAAAIAKDDFKEAVKEAKRQGGFIIWNHPGWKAQQPDTTRWFDLHTWLYENGLMNGIEICNDKEYYPIVFDWALKKKLTIFANSDIHGPIGTEYDLVNSHRPVTLVFAKERTIEAIKDALIAGQTAAFTENMVRGSEEWLKSLFSACVTISREGKKIELVNQSGIDFDVEDDSGSVKSVHLNAKASVTINSSKALNLIIKNFELAPGKYLEVVLSK